MSILSNLKSIDIKSSNPIQNTIDTYLGLEVKDDKRRAIFTIENPKITSLKEIKYFTIDFIEIDSVVYEKEFTIHPIEDGSLISNHSINRPIMITKRGFVSNIKIEQAQTRKATKTIIDKLDIISSYDPKLTNDVKSVIIKANNFIQGGIDFIDSAIADGLNVIDIFDKNAKSNTPIEKVIKVLVAIYESNQELTCYTCGRVINNMYLQKFTPNRSPDNTPDKLEIELVFQQVPKVRINSAKKVSSSMEQQIASIANKGIVSTTSQSTQTTAKKLSNFLFK